MLLSFPAHTTRQAVDFYESFYESYGSFKVSWLIPWDGSGVSRMRLCIRNCTWQVTVGAVSWDVPPLSGIRLHARWLCVDQRATLRPRNAASSTGKVFSIDVMTFDWQLVLRNICNWKWNSLGAP